MENKKWWVQNKTVIRNKEAKPGQFTIAHRSIAENDKLSSDGFRLLMCILMDCDTTFIIRQTVYCNRLGWDKRRFFKAIDSLAECKYLKRTPLIKGTKVTRDFYYTISEFANLSDDVVLEHKKKEVERKKKSTPLEEVKETKPTNNMEEIKKVILEMITDPAKIDAAIAHYTKKTQDGPYDIDKVRSQIIASLNKDKAKEEEVITKEEDEITISNEEIVILNRKKPSVEKDSELDEYINLFINPLIEEYGITIIARDYFRLALARDGYFVTDVNDKTYTSEVFNEDKLRARFERLIANGTFKRELITQ